MKRRLEALAPNAFTEDDYVQVAEYILQRYLPEGACKTDADYAKARENIRVTIRRNAWMTPEERAQAAEKAKAEVDPEFTAWMDELLSQVGTRTVGTPGAWSPVSVRPTGDDANGFAVYCHRFDVPTAAGIVTATVATTADEVWPKVMAYVRDPEWGPDLQERETTRMVWKSAGAHLHVSRIAIEDAVLRGRLKRSRVPKPCNDRELYRRALDEVVRELETRWPESTARPRSLKPAQWPMAGD